MKVRESRDTENLSKMAAKLGGNREMRFSLIAKTPKIRMSTWRRLHARYDAPETTGSVLRLHRGPLGFVVKIWDHLGPVFPSDHRFSGGGDGSEIGVGAPKTRISENPISTRKQVECCSTRWVLVKSSQTMTKLHSRFRIPPLASKIKVQKSALELKKREFPKTSLGSQTGGKLFHPIGNGQNRRKPPQIPTQREIRF